MFFILLLDSLMLIYVFLFVLSYTTQINKYVAFLFLLNVHLLIFCRPFPFLLLALVVCVSNKISYIHIEIRDVDSIKQQMLCTCYMHK